MIVAGISVLSFVIFMWWGQMHTLVMCTNDLAVRSSIQVHSDLIPGYKFSNAAISGLESGC